MFSKILLFLFRLYGRVCYFWLRSRPLPKNLGLGLQNKDICYLLRRFSLTDLVVLDFHCRRNGLTPPLLALGRHGAKANVFFVQGRFASNDEELLTLIEDKQRLDNDADAVGMELLPVSVFWGRNPGREERSFLKLLFYEEEGAGFLRRFITFFTQGRNVFCVFSQAIEIASLQDATVDRDQAARKLRRVLLIHFARQKTAVVGPSIYDRRALMQSILRSDGVRQAVDRDVKASGSSLGKVNVRALQCLDEIAADMSPPIVQLLDNSLKWLWKRVYDGVVVENGEQVRKLAEDYEVVYLPVHRSHMDYLLIGYSLYSMGLMAPHTAAGNNLNFFPAGWIIRRGGGFFIRRKFGGDRLYSTIFNEYLHVLIKSGFPLCFYPEGGRSRTGRMVVPKTGMISMVLQSMWRGQRKSKPVVVVPIYIGYDKILETHSYLKEMRGKKKKRESFSQLFSARSIIKKYLGKAYISFAEPIFLDSYAEEKIPEFWQKSFEELQKEGAFSRLATELATDSMRNISEACYVTPVALVSTIILSAEKKALTEADMLSSLEDFRTIIRDASYNSKVLLPQETAKDLLNYVEKVTPIERFEHGRGDILFISEGNKSQLLYYRNNVVHVFVIPALIASFFQHNREMGRADLLSRCIEVYQFLLEEFFLPLTLEKAEGCIAETLDILVARGFLREAQGQVSRPDLMSHQYTSLRILGSILATTIEKYAMFAGILYKYRQREWVDRSEFAQECEQLGKRVEVLTALADSQLYDSRSFKGFMEVLERSGYIECAEEKFRVNDKIGEVIEKTMLLLNDDLRKDIQVTTNGTY